MPKITVHADLGPSPRKQFLQGWHVATAEGNMAFLAENVTDDITLQRVGTTTAQGKPAVLEAIKARAREPLTELIIHEIITHGREAAVNGELRYENGAVDAFCEIYVFKNTKANTLKAITAYVIRV